jgi:hypothetical protein
LKKKRRRIVTRSLTIKELKTLRQVISIAPWKATKPDGEYAACPHAWIDRRGCKQWDYFAGLIRACGELRNWKAPWGEEYRYRYLILDRKAYWAMWPVINRAEASTLDPLPSPRPAALASLRRPATAKS